MHPTAARHLRIGLAAGVAVVLVLFGVVPHPARPWWSDAAFGVAVLTGVASLVADALDRIHHHRKG